MMDTREAIARRIWELCRQRRITPNGLATASAVPQATIKSILNGESRNPGTVTIKKLCDGFEITLGEGCTVSNTELTSTDDGSWRVGVVVGTANVGEVTITGTTSENNTLTQNGRTAPAGQSNLYGRFVPGTTGKLTIDGTEVNV